MPEPLPVLGRPVQSKIVEGSHTLARGWSMHRSWYGPTTPLEGCGIFVHVCRLFPCMLSCLLQGPDKSVFVVGRSLPCCLWSSTRPRTERHDGTAQVAFPWRSSWVYRGVVARMLCKVRNILFYFVHVFFPKQVWLCAIVKVVFAVVFGLQSQMQNVLSKGGVVMWINKLGSFVMLCCVIFVFRLGVTPCCQGTHC